jgi:hypothetical protein
MKREGILINEKPNQGARERKGLGTAALGYWVGCAEEEPRPSHQSPVHYTRWEPETYNPSYNRSESCEPTPLIQGPLHAGLMAPDTPAACFS